MTEKDRARARGLLQDIVTVGPNAFVLMNIGRQSGQDIASMFGYLYEELEKLRPRLEAK